MIRCPSTNPKTTNRPSSTQYVGERKCVDTRIPMIGATMVGSQNIQQNTNSFFVPWICFCLFVCFLFQSNVHETSKIKSILISQVVHDDLFISSSAASITNITTPNNNNTRSQSSFMLSKEEWHSYRNISRPVNVRRSRRNISVNNNEVISLDAIIDEYIVDRTSNETNNEEITRVLQILYSRYRITESNNDDDINNNNTTTIQNMTTPSVGKKSLPGVVECPLDDLVFFDNYANHTMDCMKRGSKERRKAIVCISEKVVFKRFLNRPENYERETKAFQVLTDTNYFPKLHYQNDRCQTMIIENVHYHSPNSKPDIPSPLFPHNQRWSANCTFYKDFYRNVFEIFNAHDVFPLDLNTCCNTIVDGTFIKIIDFDWYKINSTIAREKNGNKLSQLLDETEMQCRQYEEAKLAMAEQTKNRNAKQNDAERETMR